MSMLHVRFVVISLPQSQINQVVRISNQQEWEVRAAVAGRQSGDLTFPLVYCPEFHYPEFNSAVADMKNSVAVSFRLCCKENFQF